MFEVDICRVGSSFTRFFTWFSYLTIVRCDSFWLRLIFWLSSGRLTLLVFHFWRNWMEIRLNWALFKFRSCWSRTLTCLRGWGCDSLVSSTEWSLKLWFFNKFLFFWNLFVHFFLQIILINFGFLLVFCWNIKIFKLNFRNNSHLILNI